MDLSSKYGEDGAQALYMWRFAGVSFGLESRFWWTLLGSLATASLTALGAIVFKVLQTRLEDAWWLTEDLKEGLPYDGTTSTPDGVTAYGEWGSGEWKWLGYSVAGGAIIACLKFLCTLLAVRFTPCGHHSRVFPRLTPSLVVETGCLQGHPILSVFILLCGAVSIGSGASVGPEAPNGAFGAGMATVVHRLLSRAAGDVGFAEEYVLVGMAVAFVNIFPSMLIALMLIFELNASTTIVSLAAVEAALAALRAHSGSDRGAKISHLAEGELPHSRFRFDLPQFFIFAAIGGGLGALIYSSIKPHTFLSRDDFANKDLLDDLGFNKSEVFMFALKEAWKVKNWHYAAAVALGLVGAVLGVAGEVTGAVFETLGLRLLCRLDATRANGGWLRFWRRALRGSPDDFEFLSLGQFVQPLLGGVLVGLWNVLQPYCLGEGTTFFQYLFQGVNGRTLKAKNLIGIGFVKLLATRTALGFGFVGGKFFPTMFLGSSVACAIYILCNPDAKSNGKSIVNLSASDMPLMFPFCCLFCNSVTALGPMFVSIPLCVILIFGLDGEQSGVVLVSCAASYLFVHGLGKGMLPKVTEKKVLDQLALLEGHDKTTAVELAQSTDGAKLPP